MPQRLLIPDDWDEGADGYSIAVVCFPNSVLWKAYVRGAIYLFTRGKTWDEKTGIIIDAQTLGKQIYEEMCIVNCQDLVDAINNISVNVEMAAVLKELKHLNAIMASKATDLTIATPDNVDYSTSGISKTIVNAGTFLGPHVP